MMIEDYSYKLHYYHAGGNWETFIVASEQDIPNIYVHENDGFSLHGKGSLICSKQLKHDYLHLPGGEGYYFQIGTPLPLLLAELIK